jgi:hypothetical protein
MVALAQAGLKVKSLSDQMLVPTPMRALSPYVKGVFIQIPRSQTVHREPTLLFNALNKAGITTVWYANPGFWQDNYSLTVGLK